MNSLKNILMAFIAITTFVSCEKTVNTAEESATTFLPTVNIVGDSNVDLDCTSTMYTDPGATATEAGLDIPLDTKIAARYFGSSEISSPDIYDVVYSALNKDGIPGAAVRKVTIPACNGDFATSIAGMYTAYLSRTTLSSGSVVATPQYQGVGPIIIKDLGGGQFAISDAIGGWYEHGRGLGPSYAAPGMVVTANDIAGNDFTFASPTEVRSFGGALEMTGFSVDPATKTITVTTGWEFGFEFVATLIQN